MLSSEFCFVTEDDEGVFGYVMAAPDAKSLVNKCNESWVPAMKSKYPKPAKEELTAAEVDSLYMNLFVKQNSMLPHTKLWKVFFF